MATGYLIIQARTAHDALPLGGVQIWVMDAGEKHIFHLTTDESGETERIALDAPDKALSLDPNYSLPPYSSYDIIAYADGFNWFHITDIPILDGETAIQPLAFIPMSRTQRTPTVTEIQIGSPAVSMTGQREQIGTEGNPRVLRQVVIPNPITVHLGRPDASASNVQVSFPDYVKNVASSEIYPTWPNAALRANIYAIITFALNRIFTEWYRNTR